MIADSIGYINRLITASDAKIGAQKQAAMCEIIKLLDENSLNGLLASIQRDYDNAKQLALAIDVAKDNLSCLRIEKKHLSEQLEQLQVAISKRKEEFENLTLKKEQLSKAIDIYEMTPEDRSRFNTYRLALKEGEEFCGGRTNNDLISQIVRSASNVATGFTGGALYIPPVEQDKTESKTQKKSKL
jgi:chromosome segregation ATPase